MAITRPYPFMPIDFAQETEEQRLARELEDMRRMQEKYAGGILPQVPQMQTMARPEYNGPVRPQTRQAIPQEAPATTTRRPDMSNADMMGAASNAASNAVGAATGPSFSDKLGNLGDSLLSMSYHKHLRDIGEKNIERKEAAKAVNKTAEALKEMGYSEGEIKALSQDPALLRSVLTEAYKAKKGIDMPAGQREFESYLKNLSPEDRNKALRIKLGLDPRAASSLSIPMQDLLLRQYYTQTGGNIAEMEGANIDETGRRTQLRGVFDYAMGQLGNALGATEFTGKLLGNLPAMTTSAQIADAAQAIIFPIIKDIYRGKGEGTFTDADAAALVAMLPTRDMDPKAAAAALDMIYNVTMMKLQNPTLDISTFGNAMGLQLTPAAPATDSDTIAPAPAAAPAPAGSSGFTIKSVR